MVTYCSIYPSTFLESLVLWITVGFLVLTFTVASSFSIGFGNKAGFGRGRCIPGTTRYMVNHARGITLDWLVGWTISASDWAGVVDR